MTRLPPVTDLRRQADRHRDLAKGYSRKAEQASDAAIRKAYEVLAGSHRSIAESYDLLQAMGIEVLSFRTPKVRTPQQSESEVPSVAAPAGYFTFVRYEDGWAILHRDDCRYTANRANPSPKWIGRWFGPFESRSQAIRAADGSGCKVRPCRRCKA